MNEKPEIKLMWDRHEVEFDEFGPSRGTFFIATARTFGMGIGDEVAFVWRPAMFGHTQQWFLDGALDRYIAPKFKGGPRWVFMFEERNTKLTRHQPLYMNTVKAAYGGHTEKGWRAQMFLSEFESYKIDSIVGCRVNPNWPLHETINPGSFTIGYGNKMHIVKNIDDGPMTIVHHCNYRDSEWNLEGLEPSYAEEAYYAALFRSHVRPDVCPMCQVEFWKQQGK